jgi:ATP-binding cassette subfamily F protein uup
VLLVSHDRTFLDNVVTQTIASEGHGGWKDYVGGFGDWERQRTTPQKASAIEKLTTAAAPKKTSAPDKLAAKGAKMTPWETKELGQLPAEIHAIEQEQAQLVLELGNSDLYTNDSAKLAKIQARMAELESLLIKKFERWEALEARNQ